MRAMALSVDLARNRTRARFISSPHKSPAGGRAGTTGAEEERAGERSMVNNSVISTFTRALGRVAGRSESRAMPPRTFRVTVRAKCEAEMRPRGVSELFADAATRARAEISRFRAEA